MRNHTWAWGGLVNDSVIVEAVATSGNETEQPNDLIIDRGADYSVVIEASEPFTVVLKTADDQWIANLPCFYSC